MSELPRWIYVNERDYNGEGDFSLATTSGIEENGDERYVRDDISAQARNRVLSAELLSILEWLRETFEESEGGMNDLQRREIEKSERLAKNGGDGDDTV